MRTEIYQNPRKLHLSEKKSRVRLLSPSSEADSSIECSTDDTSSHGTFNPDSMPFVPNDYFENSKYRLAQCQSYHQAPYHCQYGDKCQFAHLQRNFNTKQTSYINLLEENSYQANVRIENSENNELSIFNVAKPLMNRLPIFKKFTKHIHNENYNKEYARLRRQSP